MGLSFIKCSLFFLHGKEFIYILDARQSRRKTSKKNWHLLSPWHDVRSRLRCNYHFFDCFRIRDYYWPRYELHFIYSIIDSVIWYSLIWLMISFPFFLNTWEAYYLGELNFPIIHGVSEGTLIVCSFMHISGFIGIDFFLNNYTIYGITLQFNHILVILFFISGLCYGLYSLINVRKNFKDVKDDTISSLVIFVLMMFSLFAVIFFSESTLIKTHPKLLVILFGFAFAKLVGHLQLAHLADAKFMQYRKSLVITFCFLASLSILNYFWKIKIADIDTVIISLLIMHIIVWIHFAYYLTEELCEILGINRFNIKKREITRKKN